MVEAKPLVEAKRFAFWALRHNYQERPGEWLKLYIPRVSVDMRAQKTLCLLRARPLIFSVPGR